MFKLLISLLCVIGVSVVSAADLVVIHSNTTQFPKGLLLDNYTPISLFSPAQITVVFSNGSVKTLAGPYQGKLTEPLSVHKADPNLVSTLAQLLTEKGNVYRTTVPTSKDVWLVDVSTPKRYYCVEPSQNVTLWLPEKQTRRASTMLIKHKPTDTAVKVKWPARKMTLDWPRIKMPIHYGDTYTVEITNRSNSVFKKLILYQLPKHLPTDSHKVVWMVGRGCIPQANLLLASLR